VTIDTKNGQIFYHALISLTKNISLTNFVHFSTWPPYSYATVLKHAALA